jgi:hypothetical protein
VGILLEITFISIYIWFAPGSREQWPGPWSWGGGAPDN